MYLLNLLKIPSAKITDKNLLKKAAISGKPVIISSGMSTLEEILDKEGWERIKRGLEEYKKGEYVVAESDEDIERILMKS